MTQQLAVLLTTIGFLAVMSLAEIVRHCRNLRRIPVRVHVNGTRGKSSVTRLIAAGLRAGGIRTVAKTTGTLPRLILPDGSELPVERHSRVNVIEQRDVVAAACRLRAKALVIECMAIQPQLQWLCESKLVRATHGVITNTWADHLDVMGPGEADVARALANMTPTGGKLFTAEKKHRHVLMRAAKDRRSELICIDPAEVDSVSDDEMDGFGYEEHKENVALALRVCNDLGVDRATALHAMQKATADPGATTVHEIEFFGRWIAFVNAFAANDPWATEKAWRRALADFPLTASRIAVFNCRADRPDRSAQLARACIAWPQADRYILMGTGTNVFARAALRAGLEPQKLVRAEHMDAVELFELVVELAGAMALVVGMGNIGDQGLEIVRYFRNRSALTGATESECLVRLASDRSMGRRAKLLGAFERPGIHPLPKINGNGHQHPVLQVLPNATSWSVVPTCSQPNGHTGNVHHEEDGKPES